MDDIAFLKTLFAHVRSRRARAHGIRARTRAAWLVGILLGGVLIQADVGAAHAQNGEPERELNAGYEAQRAGDLPAAAAAFGRALAADSSSLEATLGLGYTLIELDQGEAAIPVFEHAVKLAPDSADFHSQLGYLYLEADRDAEALDAFLEVERLAPDRYEDRLQLAYILDEQKDRWAAHERFLAVADAPAADPKLRKEAEESLEHYAADGIVTAGTQSADLYAEPFFTTRFQNFIVPATGRLAVSLKPRLGLDAYAVGRLVMDSRSEGGDQPSIYSDNLVGAGVGLRARPFGRWATLYAELAIAASLVQDRPDTLSSNDTRAGMTVADGWKWHDRSGEVYADASYYHRLANGILYSSVYQDVGAPFDKRGSTAYGRVRFAADWDAEFFNNILEVGPGVRFMTAWPFNLTIMAELLGGVYWRGSPPDERFYGDLRIGLILWDQRFWLAR